MNRRRIALLAAIALAGLLSTAVVCSDGEGESNDSGSIGISATVATSGAAGNSISPPSDGGANDRDEFIATVKAQLDQLDTRLDELATEIATMSGDEQAAAQGRLDTLKARQAEIEVRLEDVAAASAAEWEALKADIESRVENAMTEAQEFADEIGI